MNKVNGQTLRSSGGRYRRISWDDVREPGRPSLGTISTCRLKAFCRPPSQEGFLVSFGQSWPTQVEILHITDSSKYQLQYIRTSIFSIPIAMRALRRSISTAPLISSQYPQLRAFFGLGKRRDATSASTQPHSPESTPSGPSSGSECTICRNESGDGEMALKVPTEACAHPPQVCIGCLRQVILAAITSGDFITGIMCPSSGCPQRLGYHDVQKCAAQEVFARLAPATTLVDDILNLR
jgi:hypothetical protein